MLTFCVFVLFVVNCVLIFYVFKQRGDIQDVVHKLFRIEDKLDNMQPENKLEQMQSAIEEVQEAEQKLNDIINGFKSPETKLFKPVKKSNKRSDDDDLITIYGRGKSGNE